MVTMQIWCEWYFLSAYPRRCHALPCTNIFASLDTTVNALQLTLSLTVFTQRNVVAEFLRENALFERKRPFCVFLSPLWIQRAMYDVHLWLIGLRVVNFILVIVKLFFAKCYSWDATSENRLKIGVLERGRLASVKFSRRRRRPHKPFLHK